MRSIFDLIFFSENFLIVPCKALGGVCFFFFLSGSSVMFMRCFIVDFKKEILIVFRGFKMKIIF